MQTLSENQGVARGSEMKQTLDEMGAQMERINGIARDLVSLTDDPQPGLHTWWEMFGKAMVDMEKEMIAR